MTWVRGPSGRLARPGGAVAHRLEVLAPQIGLERRVGVEARVARQVVAVRAPLHAPVLQLVVGRQAAAHLGLAVDDEDVVGAVVARRHDVGRVGSPAVEHRPPLAAPVLEPERPDLQAAVLADRGGLAFLRRDRVVAEPERAAGGGAHGQARRQRHPPGGGRLGGGQGGAGHPRHHDARPDGVARVHLDDAARPADPVDRRGRRRRHPDLHDVGDRDGGKIEVAVVGIADRDAVDEDLHRPLARAADLDLLSAAPLLAHHQIGQELQRLRQVGRAALDQLLARQAHLGVAVERLVRPLAPDLDRLAGHRRVEEDRVLGGHRRVRLRCGLCARAAGDHRHEHGRDRVPHAR
jgi:hypothetical protein